jgi:hypothetical protein
VIRLETQINTDQIKDDAVVANKLGSDPSSLDRVSGGAFSTDGEIIKVNGIISNSEDTDTFIDYLGGFMKTITIKKKDGTVLSTTTINRNASYLITSVVEAIGDETITSTINRDVNGNITSITKTVS